MPGRTDADRAMHGEPDVALRRGLGLAGMEAYAGC